MNSEKMKEIKGKLKGRYYYLDQAYSDHLTYGGKADEQQEAEIFFLGDILTLINELESENERLRLENDVLISKKTKESVVAPIYVLPNVETPEMMLKLGEKNIVQQFAERLFEKYSYDKLTHETDENIEIHLTASELDETLKEFINEEI